MTNEHPYKRIRWVRDDSVDKDSPLIALNSRGESGPVAYVPYINERAMSEEDIDNPEGKMAHELGSANVRNFMIPQSRSLRWLEVGMRANGSVASLQANWD